MNLFSFVANLIQVNNIIKFMAKTTKKTSEVTTKSKSSVSRQALAEYVADISAKCLTPNESLIHCTIAINQILTNAESSALLDEDLKTQLKDVWLKLKNIVHFKIMFLVCILVNILHCFKKLN